MIRRLRIRLVAVSMLSLFIVLTVIMGTMAVVSWQNLTDNADFTLSILEDYLQGFPGPILAVSHDRFFLDKLAESIFEVRGDGEIHRFTGNWTYWQAKRREAEAPAPRRKSPSRRRSGPGSGS